MAGDVSTALAIFVIGCSRTVNTNHLSSAARKFKTLPILICPFRVPAWPRFRCLVGSFSLALYVVVKAPCARASCSLLAVQSLNSITSTRSPSKAHFDSTTFETFVRPCLQRSYVRRKASARCYVRYESAADLRAVYTLSDRGCELLGLPDRAPAWLGQAITAATAPLYARIILLEQQVAAVRYTSDSACPRVEACSNLTGSQWSSHTGTRRSLLGDTLPQWITTISECTCECL